MSTGELSDDLPDGERQTHALVAGMTIYAAREKHGLPYLEVHPKPVRVPDASGKAEDGWLIIAHARDETDGIYLVCDPITCDYKGIRPSKLALHNVGVEFPPPPINITEAVIAKMRMRAIEVLQNRLSDKALLFHLQYSNFTNELLFAFRTFHGGSPIGTDDEMALRNQVEAFIRAPENNEHITEMTHILEATHVRVLEKQKKIVKLAHESPEHWQKFLVSFFIALIQNPPTRSAKA